MNDDLLRTNLLDLLRATGDESRRILLAGGYGLYLKQLHLAATAQRTLIRADLWPAPRATQDLDLLLVAELVADARSMGVVRSALDQLGYVAVKGSEYLQFVRIITGAQSVKVDLLTAQLDVLQNVPSIHAESRRARPTAANRPRLHAHPTDGALALEESALEIEVAGALSNGQSFSAPVRVPQPFTYLLMKLSAFRDRRQDSNKDFGRHHALDVFRIVAMLTEPENDQLRSNVRRFANNAQVRSCAQLVRSDFAHPAAAGVLGMRQHPLWQNDQQLDIFIETLAAAFA